MYVLVFLVKFGYLSGHRSGKYYSLGLRYIFLRMFIEFSPPRFSEWDCLSDCGISLPLPFYLPMARLM